MVYNKHMRIRAFTIIELLILIVVIGILAGITVVSFSNVSQKAKENRANADLQILFKAVLVARNNTNKTLLEVTGSGCSRCVGYSQTMSSIDAISTASGINLNGLKNGDPWGNFYYIDENELEAGSCANKDSLSVTGQPGVGVILVPFFRCVG